MKGCTTTEVINMVRRVVHDAPGQGEWSDKQIEIYLQRRCPFRFFNSDFDITNKKAPVRGSLAVFLTKGYNAGYFTNPLTIFIPICCTEMVFRIVCFWHKLYWNGNSNSQKITRLFQNFYYFIVSFFEFLKIVSLYF